MRRVRLWQAWPLIAVGIAVVGCSSTDEEPVATVLVDYEHDEFATQFIAFLPDRVQAHPGDTIAFRQAWTGEPHTVTFGTAVTEVLEVTRPLIEEYGDKPESEVPPEVLEEYFAAELRLPSWYGGPEEGQGPEAEDATEGEDAPDGGDAPDGEAPEDEAATQTSAEGETGDEPSDDGDTREATDDAATDGEGTGEATRSGATTTPPPPQALAQPCLVPAGGELPEDTAPPCEDQELPPFQGTETYYNSGIIPYEGPSGNTFDLTLAEDIEPGEYGFYCAVHGSFQSGTLEVVAEDEPIATPSENARELREQVTELVAPFDATFAQAVQGRYVYAGQQHEWNYAGLLNEGSFDGIINEFVPKEITAEVDEPVVWRMFGPHSISFDVPEYMPIVEFDPDTGEVRTNEAVYEPAGGAPPVPEPDPPPGMDEDGEGEGDEPPGPPPEPEPIVIDGGTWDGSGFWSSGVLYSEAYVEYTVRVSTPGTYRFACLIHPPMVGTLTVTEPS